MAPPAPPSPRAGAAAHEHCDIRELGNAHLGVPCWSRVGFGERLGALVSAFRGGCGVIHVRMSVSGDVAEVLHKEQEAPLERLPASPQWASPDPARVTGVSSFYNEDPEIWRS